MLCGSEEGLTAPIFNSLEPRWSETFVFANPNTTQQAWPSRQQVVITVKDSNKHLPDDYLGKVGFVEALLRLHIASLPVPSQQ